MFPPLEKDTPPRRRAKQGKSPTPISPECRLRLRMKKEAGATWTTIAAALGVGENTLHKYLSGDRGPSHAVAMRMARYLSLDPAAVCCIPATSS